MDEHALEVGCRVMLREGNVTMGVVVALDQDEAWVRWHGPGGDSWSAIVKLKTLWVVEP